MRPGVGFAEAGYLEALPSQIAVIDDGFLIRVANHAWRAAARGDDYREAWRALVRPDPDLAAVVDEGVTDVLAGRRAEFVIEYPVWEDTTARWTLLRAAPCMIGGRRLALVAHVDITGRKIAERFSRIQHEVLSMVVEDAPLVATLDRLAAAVGGEAPGSSCTIHTVDAAGTSLLLAAAPGFPVEAAQRLARAPLNAFGPPTEPVTVQELSHLANDGPVATAHQRGFEMYASAPVRTRQGATLGVVVVWFNGRSRMQERVLELLELAGPLAAIALERHQTTWALRERESRMQSVFALHPDAVLILDPTGLLQSMNPAAEQLLAEAPADLLGQSFSRLVVPQLVSRFQDRLRRALTGYPQRFTIAVHPRGRPQAELDMTFVPLLSGGTVSGIYAVAKDLTEQLAAAEQLEQSGRQLRQSAKMEAVGRLAGGIAHDFNNLLTGIRGYTDLLLTETELGDRVRGDLSEIGRAVDRATTLTRQLLAFSRQQVVQRRLIDLNATVEECRSMLVRLLRADTQLALVADPRPLWILADPVQIHQVIINLVVNAQDAMPNGGQITLTTGHFVMGPDAASTLAPLDPGTYVTLSIADTGRGMTQEIQAHIFEPFFTTKPPGQGTGLGLSTVYGIVEQSGGRIGFRSAVDAGSVFVIYLPERTAGARGEAGVAEVPRASVRGGSETILLVENDESVRRMVRKILAGSGYRVLEARHGGDALVVSREHGGPIDLLLTDVVMPELNGLRLADILRQERPETEVVFMSGYARDEVDRRGLMQPGVLFIHKPFTVAELAETVRSALDRESARSDARS